MINRVRFTYNIDSSPVVVTNWEVEIEDNVWYRVYATRYVCVSIKYRIFITEKRASNLGKKNNDQLALEYRRPLNVSPRLRS